MLAGRHHASLNSSTERKGQVQQGADGFVRGVINANELVHTCDANTLLKVLPSAYCHVTTMADVGGVV
jgi:hypothetical protein